MTGPLRQPSRVRRSRGWVTRPSRRRLPANTGGANPGRQRGPSRELWPRPPDRGGRQDLGDLLRDLVARRLLDAGDPEKLPLGLAHRQGHPGGTGEAGTRSAPGVRAFLTFREGVDGIADLETGMNYPGSDYQCHQLRRLCRHRGPPGRAGPPLRAGRKRGPRRHRLPSPPQPGPGLVLPPARRTASRSHGCRR